MPLRNFDLDESELLSAEAIEHVLEGDGPPNYSGGHRYSSTIIGKTVFPEHWTDEDVIAALRVTLTHPAKVAHHRQEIILLSLVDEVVIEVRVELTRRGPRIQHAFPRSGAGVFRNDPTRRTPIPLDLSELEQ